MGVKKFIKSKQKLIYYNFVSNVHIEKCIDRSTPPFEIWLEECNFAQNFAAFIFEAICGHTHRRISCSLRWRQTAALFPGWKNRPLDSNLGSLIFGYACLRASYLFPTAVITISIRNFHFSLKSLNQCQESFWIHPSVKEQPIEGFILC